MGGRERKHKAWITPETLVKLEDRNIRTAYLNNSRPRAAKISAQTKYTRASFLFFFKSQKTRK